MHDRGARRERAVLLEQRGGATAVVRLGGAVLCRLFGQVNVQRTVSLAATAWARSPEATARTEWMAAPTTVPDPGVNIGDTRRPRFDGLVAEAKLELEVQREMA